MKRTTAIALASLISCAAGPASAEHCTEGADIVPPRAVSLEGGWTFSRGASEREDLIGQVFARVGLGKGIEGRASASSYSWSRTGDARSEGLTDAGAGLKWRFNEPGGGIFRPAAAMAVSATVPTGGSRIRASHAGAEAKLCLEWGSLPTLAVLSNVGLTRVCDGDALVAEPSGSVSVVRTLLSGCDAFLEVATHAVTHGDPTHEAIAGVRLAAPPGLEIEVRLGAMPTSEPSTWFGGLIFQRQWE